jgi:hypothetical protein
VLANCFLFATCRLRLPNVSCFAIAAAIDSATRSAICSAISRESSCQTKQCVGWDGHASDNKGHGRSRPQSFHERPLLSLNLRGYL